MSKILIKQTRSVITESHQSRRILQALGLGRIGQARLHKDNNCIRGMVNKVKHLVSYELKTAK